MILWYLSAVNLAGFLLCGMDKARARRRQRRISERTLFVTALLGGSAGLLLGMGIFRHKSRRPKFVLGIPLILTFQLLLACILLLK